MPGAKPSKFVMEIKDRFNSLLSWKDLNQLFRRLGVSKLQNDVGREESLPLSLKLGHCKSKSEMVEGEEM